MVKSMMVEVSDVNEVQLKGKHIQHPNIPEKYELILNIRYGEGLLKYQKGNLTHNVIINGFYLLNTERAKFTLQSKGGSNKYVEIMGEIKDIRCNLPSGVKIIAELSPKEFWEIDNLLGGHDIEISWTIDGYGFVFEEFIVNWDRDELGENELISQLDQLVPISFKSVKRYSISHEVFVKNVLEPVDRFQREYIEIPFPTTELLDRAPSDLKPIAEFIKGRLEELKNVQRDLSSAKTSRDYANVIVGTRKAIEVKGVLEQSENILAEKLYCDGGILSGAGAQERAKEQIKDLLKIYTLLFDLASGLGVHSTTRDKTKPLIANPERSDANYLLLMAMLTLGYLAEKLRRSIETT
ncbi:MAG TPA: hypothetical protein VMW67_03810 [Desulfobacteria bacterium]|nr:hypothetical protein [Desulfobacteria bacterium]